MKSFLIACLLFALVVGFVCFHTYYMSEILGQISDIVQMLPQNKQDFFDAYDTVRENVRTLYDVWDRHFSYIAFTIAYENINRCDEALENLKTYAQNANAEEFTVALAGFRDALSRLRMLEGFYIESIF